MVAEDGSVSRPVPADDRLFSNATTSLSGYNSADDFRFIVLPFDSTLPPLVLLSTDGYANSFRTDADFLQVGRDLLAMIRADGLDPVLGELEGWLSRRPLMAAATISPLGYSAVPTSAEVTDERRGETALAPIGAGSRPRCD